MSGSEKLVTINLDHIQPGQKSDCVTVNDVPVADPNQATVNHVI